MARPLRLHLPGGFYHVTSRGNERKEIFAGEEELEKFVGYWPEWITRCRLRLHGCVMMTNVPLELGQNLKGQMVLRDEKTVTEVQARLAGDRTRDVLLWLARRYAGLKLTELGALAGGLDYRSAGSALLALFGGSPKARSPVAEARESSRKINKE